MCRGFINSITVRNMCMYVYCNRVSSGAQIKIAGNEGDNQDRLVTITGTPEAVGMAQYLINSRLAVLQQAVIFLAQMYVQLMLERIGGEGDF